ncbi:hypothetical protein DCS_05883 [Drechmeria coniospora]|uniref:Intradiol ring-cleavage dioxygenases domain-containing protein n=1 Tax=Drechmeria coniospora TaxID=98403 RepID=A0A151GP22_DRECN|nr:hypothetical protein DCS_05883 [Drechmeria coniospora]KYK58865.1 hypothetical protein DCS_05883 [Drechmeria coniospora]
MRFQSLAACTFGLLASRGLGHPGHDANEERAERLGFLSSSGKRSLDHCAEKLALRGVEKRNVLRRSQRTNAARVKRSLSARDVDAALNKSHDDTSLGYTVDTDPATLFSGNRSCVLTPEVTQGPYYVSGERVRENIVDGQDGISLFLDLQVIDVETCEPVPDVYVEIWHCNSTGVYSGVVAQGNGNSQDASNINNTFLRGIQATDADGVANFESLMPGHYTGRTTHVHVMVHTNATLYKNETLGNQIHASHVGQVFFDQELITAIEAIEPYSSNTQQLTTNAEDSIFAQEAGTSGVDPIMQYTRLGDDLNSGIFAWIAFGINTSYSGVVTPAVFLYDSGGVENQDSGMGGGSGGPGGAPPAGTPPDGGPRGGSASTAVTAAGTVTGSSSSRVNASNAAGISSSPSGSNVSPTSGTTQVLSEARGIFALLPMVATLALLPRLV